MQHRVVQLGPEQAPDQFLRALTDQLGGVWLVEGALETWRAEQEAGGFIRSVGLTRGPDGWVLAWRVDPDVPDSAALAVVGAAVGLSVLALAITHSLGLGGGALLASAGTLLLTLRVGRWIVRARLPDAAPAAQALTAALIAEVSDTTARRSDPAPG